jgi:hypothetical protein
LSPSKYGNRRVHTPDGWFDSQRELRRWGELKLMEKAGKITDLKRQVRFDLVPKMRRGQRPIFYLADFVYMENGKRVVEDSKGYRDRLYMLKWRLMEWVHGIEILET